MDNEMHQLLIEASDEIKRLRRQNEILHAKQEMIDLFACVLHTTPARHENGMAVDIAWKLDKMVDRPPLKGYGGVPVDPDDPEVAC